VDQVMAAAVCGSDDSLNPPKANYFKLWDLLRKH
jgi:hypothetical protein